jgi:pilus assembly protein Flp/PilA
MNHFSRLLTALHQDESGQDLVEYALIGALMALGAVTSLKSVANGVGTAFTAIGSTITSGI